MWHVSESIYHAQSEGVLVKMFDSFELDYFQNHDTISKVN